MAIKGSEMLRWSLVMIIQQQFLSMTVLIYFHNKNVKKCSHVTAIQMKH